MYRKFIVIVFFFVGFHCFSQNSQLAYSYYQKGEYEKAAVLYKQLYENNKVRRDYFKQLLSCYQLTDNFAAADKLLANHHQEFPNQKYVLIETGYNFQLQEQEEKAIPYYDKAIESINKDPIMGYILGQTFQENHLLDYALKAYKKAMELNPELNYDAYIAFIYGEKADIENMFKTYLDMVEKNENYYTTVQQYAGRFLSDDNLDKNNILFRKLVLKRLQQNPNNSWNKLLSWLYIQQHDYEKSLTQEIALFKRNQENLGRIIELGKTAFNNNDNNAAREAFIYVQKNTNDQSLILNAKLYLLQIDIRTASTKKEIEAVDVSFQQLFNTYSNAINTLDIQIAYADFLTFKRNNPHKAIKILKDALTKTTSDYQYNSVKLKLADVLVYISKFNEALIYYSQIKTHLKNSILAQKASFKVAQTSYFKGDFKWALTQLKVLKKATSQLIANDALELNLLISNNVIGDSISIQALKKYASADLLAYQNKNEQAIDTLNFIIKVYKGRSIEDEAFFKRADLFTKVKKYKDAENDYYQIISLQNDGILVDNAYFKLGLLYEYKLNNLEKAKEMYQKIIFDFPSSIYLIEARKRFRKLRGDIVN